ncbi:hypothetical protein I1A45_01060 [Pectobacterium versatile]|nr:hypothetical protein [Pectobacterium versatile]
MSVNPMSRLEQYRASQAERIEMMSRAIDEGLTTVVSSKTPAWKIIRCVFIGTPYSSKIHFWAVRRWPQAASR